LQACFSGAASVEPGAALPAGAALSLAAGAALEGDCAGGFSAQPVAPTRIPPTAAAINECEIFMVTSCY
jgi:hypothetical protein